MDREAIESLPLYPEGRKCRRPTARRLIDLFEDMQRHSLRVGRRQPAVVFTTELSRLQRRLLRLLGMTNVYDALGATAVLLRESRHAGDQSQSQTGAIPKCGHVALVLDCCYVNICVIFSSSGSFRMRLISQFSRASGARFSETDDSPETVVGRWILLAKLKARLLWIFNLFVASGSR